MASTIDRIRAAQAALIAKAKSGQKITQADITAYQRSGLGSKGFLDNVAKAAGKVVAAPVKLTATVAASPFKLTAKVTGVKAIAKVGSGISSVVRNPLKPVAKATTAVSKQVKKIPVVGKPLSAVVNLGNAPVKLVAQVSSGENINQAVLNNIKEQVKSVKEIAPYAKMCVSLIPGVGTAVSAAISAGAALATGQSITDAMISGIKGAIPGGMVAQTAFSISTDVLSGKSLNTAAINALPLTNTQKTALNTTVNLAKDLAAGKNVSKSVLANVQRQLPTDVQKAINIGIAVGFGKSHQKKAIAPPIKKPAITVNGKPAPAKVQAMFTIPKTVARTPTPAEKTQIEGKAIVDKDPILKAGFGQMKTEGDKHGFYSAIGMMAHTATPAEISKFQSTVPTTDKNGFNIGCAAVVGIKLLPKKTGNNLADFATAVALGLKGATQPLKVSAVKTVGTNPVAAQAIINVAATKKGWLHRLLVKLGFIKELKAIA